MHSTNYLLEVTPKELDIRTNQKAISWDSQLVCGKGNYLAWVHCLNRFWSVRNKNEVESDFIASLPIINKWEDTLKKGEKEILGVSQFTSFILPPTPTLSPPLHACPFLNHMVLKLSWKFNGGFQKGTVRNEGGEKPSKELWLTVHTFVLSCPVKGHTPCRICVTSPQPLVSSDFSKILETLHNS